LESEQDIVVEEVEALFGNEIIEESSSEVLASKSQVHRELALPKTGRRCSSRLVDYEDLVRGVATITSNNIS